jgi:hypothetical protein
MADIVRGRRQLVAVLGGATAFLVLLSVGRWLRNGESQPIRTFGPLVVFCLLGGLAYFRFYWARGAVVVWLGLIAIFDGLGAILLMRRSPLASLVVLAVAAAITRVAVFLYTSEHIEAFLLSNATAPRRSRSAT